VRSDSSIGKLPAEWQVRPLGELLTLAQYGLSVRGNGQGSCPILRMTNQVAGRIVARDLQFADIGPIDLVKFRVESGDLLFNRTNSFDLVGRTAIFDLKGDFVFASYLIRLRTSAKQLNSHFLNFYLNGDETQRRLKSIATRAVSQSNISATRLKTFPVPVPPLDEQCRIARVLSAVQRAIERQKQLIALTAELKKALMHKLFTEGTRGEPPKQTEIGAVPESWRTEPLDQQLSAAQYGLSVKSAADGKTPMLRMTNQVDGRIVADALQSVNISDVDRAKFRVEPLDILFNRTNSFELVGRTAIFDLPGEYVFASYLIRLRTCPDTLRARFLNHYLNWGATQARLKGIASRAVSQSNISASRLRGFVIPIPSPNEQDEIDRCIDAVDSVRSIRLRQLTVFEGLFRTLLHQLMTAQVRVHDLDMSALNELAIEIAEVT